jgi:hypothetical protein
MSKVLLPLFIVAVFVIAGCVVFQKAEASDTLDEEEIAVLLSEPNTVDWEYPITAKVWYPGDAINEKESFLYYTIRCWPGCHDPNSQPRPAKY